MSPLIVSQDVAGLDVQIARLGAFDALAKPHLIRAMSSSVAVVEGNAKRGAPVGVSGHMRRSIGSKVETAGASIVGKVGSSIDSPYPATVEFGRRPGAKMPPPDALERWVELVMGVKGSDLHSVAYLVARKIARFGTKGVHFLSNALKAGIPQIRANFREAGDKIVKELRGNGR